MRSRNKGLKLKRNSSSPRVYIADLAAYNEGKLHGLWVDAYDEDEMREAADKLLASSPAHGAEEIAIHDYEGFGDIKIEEYMPLSDVAAIAQLIDDLGEGIVSVVWNNLGSGEGVDVVRETIEEHYAGSADSVEDWAYDYLQESGQLDELPEWAKVYAGTLAELFARDLEYGGEIYTGRADGQVHVFWSR